VTASAVHLYYADRRVLREELAAPLVTDDDRRRLTAGMAARRRAEYLAGRALLRYALERYTQRPAASFRIVVAAEGRPECVDGPKISLAHSGNVVVCAVTECDAVGVDVETRGPRSAIGGIAERYFTPAEAEWVAVDPDARFRMLWVLKEAYLKALGVGLKGGLARLECRIEPPRIVAHASGGAVPQLALWRGPDCDIGVAALGARSLTVVAQRWAVADEPDAIGPLQPIAASAT
jgi:4'-phosphopantetheinyl transferase